VGTKKKDPAAVSLGQKGGKARAARLSREQLSQIGKKGAQARWGRRKTKRESRGGFNTASAVPKTSGK